MKNYLVWYAYCDGSNSRGVSRVEAESLDAAVAKVKHDTAPYEVDITKIHRVIDVLEGDKCSNLVHAYINMIQKNSNLDLSDIFKSLDAILNDDNSSKEFLVKYTYMNNSSHGWSKVEAPTYENAVATVKRDTLPYEIQVSSCYMKAEGLTFNKVHALLHTYIDGAKGFSLSDEDIADVFGKILDDEELEAFGFENYSPKSVSYGKDANGIVADILANAIARCNNSSVKADKDFELSV